MLWIRTIVALDDEGVECQDQAAASKEALRALCEIAAHQPDRYIDQPLRVTVRNGAGAVVLTATMSLHMAWHVDGEACQAA